jgi:aldehyde:ferredoxin oxidoreductase
MPHGYHGAYLRVDVTDGSASRVALSDATLREFLGGSGLGVRLLLDEGAAGFAPLAPEAPLVFAFSPLVGSPLTTSAKFAVVSKSPLTERINDSLASSGFAVAGKQCGCDALMIVGRAADLSVLIIEHEGHEGIDLSRRSAKREGGRARVRLVSAAAYRGATCRDTESGLRAELGPEYRIASIGPAGEQLVRYATISHDGRHAGRGGSGAVLGAKNIKAIAVRGALRVEWAHPQELTTLSRDLSKRSFGPATAKYRELGTATNLLTFNRFNALPTRNFQRGTFEGALDISPEQMATTRAKTRDSCVTCTIGCEHLYAINPASAFAHGATADKNAGLHTGIGPQADNTAGGVGLQAGNTPGGVRLQAGNTPGGVRLQADNTESVRVEYESLFALGSLCGISDPEVVLRASRRCDDLGIDTISAGGTIAFAMECVDRGWLDEPWLRFGSGDALLRAIDLIGSRTGIGRLLAEGSRRAALAIGHDSIGIAPQVKGLEIPGYEPRALQTMALGFAVGARGADHNRSGAYEVDFSGKVDRRNVTLDAVRHAIETEDKAALMDSLILCKFLRGVFEDFYAECAVMLRAVTGWDATADELRETAKRIVAAKRQFNLLAGWTPAEDTLPERFLNTPLPDDPAASLSRTRLNELVAEYHRQRHIEG